MCEGKENSRCRSLDTRGHLVNLNCGDWIYVERNGGAGIGDE